jgi:predicted DNA-binding mobile mystery protein A
MNEIFRDLKLRQVDKLLTSWRSAALPARPPAGWIKTIREALGMSSAYLAKKLGIVPSSLLRLEESEKDNTITLQSLQRVAEILGCDLQYALVPKQTITEVLNQRANTIAYQRMESVAHTMSLEAQSTSAEITESQTKQLVKELLSGSRRELWR